jgi:hypothetical protein
MPKPLMGCNCSWIGWVTKGICMDRAVYAQVASQYSGGYASSSASGLRAWFCAALI